MRKLRVGILDITTKAPTRALYARVMNANLASIMPQVVGVWCEQLGHRVTYVCYTGFEDLKEELPEFYTALIKRDLGEFWGWLPEGAMFHDPYAYLKAHNSKNRAQIARTP